MLNNFMFMPVCLHVPETIAQTSHIQVHGFYCFAAFSFGGWGLHIFNLSLCCLSKILLVKNAGVVRHYTGATVHSLNHGHALHSA